METHGQVGVENEMTPQQIKAAKAVIVAADKDVHQERFVGKPLVSGRLRLLSKIPTRYLTGHLRRSLMES